VLEVEHGLAKPLHASALFWVAKIAFFSPFSRAISFSRTSLLLLVIEPTGMPGGGWRVEARASGLDN
jgi:hypothetical protein